MDIRDNWLTPKELAYMLRISTQTLTKLRLDGNGPPFIRLRKHIFYPKDKAFAWIEANIHG